MRKHSNATYVVTVVIVYAFMLGAAAISFSHIVDVSHTLGLGWEAWTVPFFVDGIAVLGKIGRSGKFAARTQRAGLALMAGAGALSLTCNVMAGDNLGQQLYGGLVVAGFITTEWYAAKLEAAPPATPVVDDAVKAKRSEAARKAAVTRKANKAKATRKPRAPKDSGEAARMLAAAGVAPVSPA